MQKKGVITALIDKVSESLSALGVKSNHAQGG